MKVYFQTKLLVKLIYRNPRKYKSYTLWAYQIVDKLMPKTPKHPNTQTPKHSATHNRLIVRLVLFAVAFNAQKQSVTRKKTAQAATKLIVSQTNSPSFPAQHHAYYLP